jgi:hypothetical protein
MTSTASGPASSTAFIRAFGAIVLVFGAAAVTGFLTPYASIHLPGSINVVANSSGSWAMVAFASVYLSNARGLFAAVLGACSFVVMDVVFFFAFENRLGAYSHDAIAFWLFIGIVVGPVVGLSASWLRSPHAVLREIACAAPASVLIGEGAFMIIQQPGLSPVYAHASVVVGVLVFLVLALWKLRRFDRTSISVVFCVAAAAALYVTYALMPLIGKSAP